MSAREEILARIRSAAVPPRPPVELAATTRPGDVDLFIDRLVDYRARVSTCAEADTGAVIAGLLAGTTTLVVPRDVPAAWLTGYQGEVRKDGEPLPLTAAELDAAGVTVLTGCAVAIARTGTLVLDTSAAQGRRLLTLVPDHHICVVHTGQILDDVPDALARLAGSAAPTSPLTFISGPSATSDIELDRVEGVHGPRRLEVVIVHT